ncbi:MAG: hypothetical protein HY890_05135 [Deltaproteobacteria bacterium]|nr:hypothetical protein [Deltaproteobacteria bacterium]
MRKKGFLHLLVLISIFLAVGISYSSENAQDRQAPVGGNAAEMVEAVKKRAMELDEREERLRIEEEGLKAVKAEVEGRIAELSMEREKVEKVLTAMKEEGKKGMENLAKVYETMAAEEAAARMEKMDMELAVKLLLSMKNKTAGRILAFVEPQKAAHMTREMSKGMMHEQGRTPIVPEKGS